MSDYTILGASGYIGRHLKRVLEADGFDVFAPARDDPSIFFRPLGRVFFCIGMTADYRERPASTIEAHAGIITKLIEAGNFAHLVYLSSTRLYDLFPGTASTTGVERIAVDPQNPRHLYDISKLLGENVCLTYAGERTSVARLSGVYGFTEDAPGFLSELVRRALSSRKFTLDSADGIVRDYIRIDDTIDALRRLADPAALASTYGIVNVASGMNVSNGDIAAVFNARGWAIDFTRRCERQSLARCDIARLHSLGSEPSGVLDVLGAWIDAGCPTDATAINLALRTRKP